MEVLLENAQSLLQGDGWKLIVMWVIGAVLIYLAIAKDMEPSLLLPIGFGAILMNLPGAFRQLPRRHRCRLHKAISGDGAYKLIAHILK